MRSSSRPRSKVTPHVPPPRLNMGGYTVSPMPHNSPSLMDGPGPRLPCPTGPPGVPEALLPAALVSPRPHHLVISSPAVPVTALRSSCPLTQMVPECPPKNSAAPAPGPAVPALRCPVSPSGEPAAPVPAVLSLSSSVSPLLVLHHTLPWHPVYSVTPLEAPLPSAVTGAPGPTPRPRCRRCPHPGSLRGSAPLPRCPRCP